MIFDANIACGHVSGLLMRQAYAAGPYGFRKDRFRTIQWHPGAVASVGVSDPVATGLHLSASLQAFTFSALHHRRAPTCVLLPPAVRPRPAQCRDRLATVHHRMHAGGLVGQRTAASLGGCGRQAEQPGRALLLCAAVTRLRQHRTAQRLVVAWRCGVFLCSLARRFSACRDARPSARRSGSSGAVKRRERSPAATARRRGGSARARSPLSGSSFGVTPLGRERGCQRVRCCEPSRRACVDGPGFAR